MAVVIPPPIQLLHGITVSHGVYVCAYNTVAVDSLAAAVSQVVYVVPLREGNVLSQSHLLLLSTSLGKKSGSIWPHR